MATLEFEKTKAAIVSSSLREALELAAVLKAHLESLGAKSGEFDEAVFGPAPMPGAPETWAEIYRELAAHDVGEKGFSLAELRSLIRD
jgi:hypothetical protein